MLVPMESVETLTTVASTTPAATKTYQQVLNTLGTSLTSDIHNHYMTLKLIIGDKFIGTLINSSISDSNITFELTTVGGHFGIYVMTINTNGTGSTAKQSTDGAAPTDISSTTISSSFASLVWKVVY